MSEPARLGPTAMPAGLPARAGDVAHRHAVRAWGVDHSKVGVQVGRFDAGLSDATKQGPVQLYGEAVRVLGGSPTREEVKLALDRDSVLVWQQASSSAALRQETE